MIQTVKMISLFSLPDVGRTHPAISFGLKNKIVGEDINKGKGYKNPMTKEIEMIIQKIRLSHKYQ